MTSPTDPMSEALAQISTLQASLAAAEGERDRAYIAIIDTCGFLVAEVAANRLIKVVPESFDDREEAARAALTPTGEGK